ncbi:MAG: hypothetical protein OXS29_18950 [bacterium]|nr:hypothetical protein [bacterium]
MAEPPYYSGIGKGRVGWGRAAACEQQRSVAWRTLLNSGAPWPAPDGARVRVLDHQRKLYRWARAEPGRRFGDVFNLVHDPATLVVA